MNHSTVLRRLASLEKRLGSRLFDRSPDGYEITAQGEQLRNQLRGVSEQIESAQRSLSRARSQAFRGDSHHDHRYLDSWLADASSRRVPRFESGDADRDSHQQYFLEFDPARSPRFSASVEYCSRKSGGEARRASLDRDYASRSYLKKNAKKKEWAAHDWVAPEKTLSHLAQAKWMRENIPEDRIVVHVDSLA